MSSSKWGLLERQHVSSAPRVLVPAPVVTQEIEVPSEHGVAGIRLAKFPSRRAQSTSPSRVNGAPAPCAELTGTVNRCNASPPMVELPVQQRASSGPFPEGIQGDFFSTSMRRGCVSRSSTPGTLSSEVCDSSSCEDNSPVCDSPVDQSSLVVVIQDRPLKHTKTEPISDGPISSPVHDLKGARDLHMDANNIYSSDIHPFCRTRCRRLEDLPSRKRV